MVLTQVEFFGRTNGHFLFLEPRILFFQFFDPANLQLSGLDVTITGLPSIPGGPANVAGISPFAGDGAPTSPEELNQIATEAGEGSTPATCWDAAIGGASTGQVTNLSYGTSFEETVASAASCGGTL